MTGRNPSAADALNGHAIPDGQLFSRQKPRFCRGRLAARRTALAGLACCKRCRRLQPNGHGSWETTVMASRRLLILAAVACFGLSPAAKSQTPSPLQEWQYSGGIALQKLFEPQMPDWRVVLGTATEAEPTYEGARPYRFRVGPVINVQYKDLAFASLGEGLGLNLLRADHYRVGVAVGYDLGRHISVDYPHLHGLEDIASAPVVRVFGSYAISKEFPLVLRADVRRIVGGEEEY